MTPTIPERSEWLEECRASVTAQSVPHEHLIALDEKREGPAAVCNRLALEAQGEWLFPFGDDDLLDPDAFEVLAGHEAEIVYGWCRVEGSNWNPNRLFHEPTLRKRNYIPGAALIRKSLWDSLGGYRSVHHEDWDLWLRALDAGARFHCCPEVCWTYRQHDSNLFNPQTDQRRAYAR